MRTYEIEAHELTETPTAVVRATLRVDELPAWFGHAFGRTAGYLAARGAGPAGPPFARYHRRDDGLFDVEAGFPALRAVEAEDGESGEVVGATLPDGPAAVTVHVGPYDQMEPAYEALAAWVVDHGFTPTGDAWEVYFSDPQSQPDPATWRTEIVQPFR